MTTFCWLPPESSRTGLLTEAARIWSLSTRLATEVVMLVRDSESCHTGRPFS